MPPLDAVISEKTKIPAGLEAYYVERDGKFVLDVPGMKTQTDFDNYAEALKKRFADASTDLSKKNGAGLSRDEVLEVMETALKKFSPAGTPAAGAGNGQAGDELKARLHDLERNVASLSKTNEELIKERDNAVTTTKNTTITNKLTEAAVAAGVNPDSVHNLVRLVKDDFETAQDGSVVTKLETASGVSPNQSPKDFFTGLSRNKAFRPFWPPSKGGGADGEGGSGGGGGGDLGKSNPWTKAGWNMTEQGRLYKADKTEASRLMEAAGVKLGATQPVR